MRQRIVDALAASPASRGLPEAGAAGPSEGYPGYIRPPPAGPTGDKDAAVLIPLHETADGISVILTERAAHLARHPGQVAFPGGRIEQRDLSPHYAALREAEEEIGLESRRVEIVGTLNRQRTGTGFLVTPVVGFFTGPFKPRPDPNEVAAVFSVPLDFLLNPINCERTSFRDRGRAIRTFEIQWQQWRIWGATAHIIVAFRDLITI